MEDLRHLTVWLRKCARYILDRGYIPTYAPAAKARAGSVMNNVQDYQNFFDGLQPWSGHVPAGYLVDFLGILTDANFRTMFGVDPTKTGGKHTTTRLWTPGGLLGDAVRIWHAHRAGLTLPFAIGSVILDRIAVVLSLILATTLLQYFLPAAVRSRFQIVGPVDLLSLLAITSIAGVGLLIWLDKLPASLQSRIPIAGLLTLSLSARRIFLNPVALASVLLLALTSQAFVCAAIYTLARSLDIGISLLDCMILMPPVILLSLLPVSIGGWGVRESVMVFVLNLIGIASEQALLLSVLLGLVGMAISLPGWILWMTSPLDIKPDSELRMRTASPQANQLSSTGE